MGGPTASIARLASVVLLAICLQGSPANAAITSNAVCTPIDPDTQLDRYTNAPGGLDARITAQQCRDLLTPSSAAGFVYDDPEERAAAAEGSGLTYIADWKEFSLNGSKFDNFVLSHGADLLGFSAGVFEDAASNTVYVAFAGTELTSVSDWMTNAQRGFGGDPAQYHLADMVGLAAKQTYEAQGKKVVFVGHSLGGGLAMRASRTTGLEAIVFNSDGIPASHMEQMTQQDHARIQNIFVADDPLHLPSWENADPSLTQRLFKDRISQPGQMTWIPHYRSCEVSEERALSAATNKSLQDLAEQAGLEWPEWAGSVVSLPLDYVERKVRERAFEVESVYIDYIEPHLMGTVENYLQICAGIVPADSEFNNVIGGIGGENSESDFGDSKHPNGEGVLPPKIEYQCVFSC